MHHQHARSAWAVLCVGVLSASATPAVAQLPDVAELLDAMSFRTAALSEMFVVYGRVGMGLLIPGETRIRVALTASVVVHDRGDTRSVAERTLSLWQHPAESRVTTYVWQQPDLEQVARTTEFTGQTEELGRFSCELRERPPGQHSRYHRLALGLELLDGRPVSGLLREPVAVDRAEQFLGEEVLVLRGAEGRELWLAPAWGYAPVRALWQSTDPNSQETTRFEWQWLGYHVVSLGTDTDGAQCSLPALYVSRSSRPGEAEPTAWRATGLTVVQIASCFLNENVEPVVPKWHVPIIPGASVHLRQGLPDDQATTYGYRLEELWQVGEGRLAAWELPVDLPELAADGPGEQP